MEQLHPNVQQLLKNTRLLQGLLSIGPLSFHRIQLLLPALLREVLYVLHWYGLLLLGKLLGKLLTRGVEVVILAGAASAAAEAIEAVI